MRDKDDSLTIQLPNGKCESILSSLFSWRQLTESNCRYLSKRGARAKRVNEHLLNIKLSMEFICFSRHAHKIAHIISIIGSKVARHLCARAPPSNWLESVWKHLPTCICIQQFIGSILCKCCHVVINPSCPTVVLRSKTISFAAF